MQVPEKSQLVSVNLQVVSWPLILHGMCLISVTWYVLGVGCLDVLNCSLASVVKLYLIKIVRLF